MLKKVPLQEKNVPDCIRDFIDSDEPDASKFAKVETHHPRDFVVRA
jgi:hypothetical protein